MIVVYYGVDLSLSLPFCLSSSLPLFIFPPSSSAYAPILIPISSIVLRLISSSLFPSRLHPLPVFQSRRVPPALALPHLFFFPFLVLFQPLNLARPRPSFSFSFSFSFSSGLYFSAPDVPPVANIVFLPPPLDMAKEAICALLAILEHFFEAFSPLDLFFASSPFCPVHRPFPAFLHPGCRRFPSSAHPVSSSIPTYSISRPSAQVDIIPAWFPSLSETSARAVFIFRASVA